MTTMLISVLLITLLLILSAFFSGSETALFSLNKADLLRFKKSKFNKERKLAKVMRSPQKILISILIGNLFVNTFLSALTTDLMTKQSKAYGHFITILIVTPLIIIFCEITPKVLSVNNYEKISKRVISFLYFFHVIIFPLRVVFLAITNLFIRIFRIKVNQDSIITEDELDMAVTMGESSGVLGKHEGGFLKNVLRFSKREAANVMVPRNEALAISNKATIQDAVKLFKQTSAVRLPVYAEDMDHIVGQIDSRDLIPYVLEYKKAKTLKTLIQPIEHYPASKELDELLDDFLKNNLQLAVVVDEYGGTAGFVTLSSIIAEVMGSEFSLIEEERKKYEIKKIAGGSYVILGEMQLDDFGYEFNEKVQSSETETVAGYFIENVGHFPKKGETLDIDNHRLKVRSVAQNRIEKIEVIELGKNK